MTYKQAKEMEKKKQENKSSKNPIKEISNICKDSVNNLNALLDVISFDNKDISNNFTEGKVVKGSLKALAKLCAAYSTGIVVMPVSIGLAIGKIKVDSNKLNEKIQSFIDDLADGTIKEKVLNKLKAFKENIKNLISSFNKNSMAAYDKFAKENQIVSGGDNTYLSTESKEKILEVLKEKKIPIETKKIRGEECHYFKVGGIEYGLEDNGLHVYGSKFDEISTQSNLKYLAKQLGDKSISEVGSIKVKSLGEGKIKPITDEQRNKLKEERRKYYKEALENRKKGPIGD